MTEGLSSFNVDFVIHVLIGKVRFLRNFEPYL